MGSFELPRLAELDEDAIARFREQGFLIVERVLDVDRIAALHDRFPKLFARQFDTAVYPDEWHWREGMSLPDVTRHMANAWKADLTVARLALSRDVSRAAARLAGWSGRRLGQDTIWWKTCPRQSRSRITRTPPLPISSIPRRW
jgi:phytanoyl-CoA hydroxylase